MDLDIGETRCYSYRTDSLFIAMPSEKNAAATTLNLKKIPEFRKKIQECNPQLFKGEDHGYSHFTKEIDIHKFRHISNLKVRFKHPVTVISGSNKSGKTSILILLACSHEKFIKIDSTKPSGERRIHNWSDVVAFTKHETQDCDYSYSLKWRVGDNEDEGIGKRLASSQSWSGLGKKSQKNRKNAKIKSREVRMIDLERILPARSFSNALYRKANASSKIRLNPDIEKAFGYIFDLTNVEIYAAGQHIYKSCFFISTTGKGYSSYNAATGEESVIYLLQDIFEAPKGALILIDEIEAGLHPKIQRKISDVILFLSWEHKKQFIVTTHSPSFLSSFPEKSRVFIENFSGKYRAIEGISTPCAWSKMDAHAYPLISLYCEDDLTEFLIKKATTEISQKHQYFDRLFEVIKSGPANDVIRDYVRHQRNLLSRRYQIGYAAILDGDMKTNPSYSSYYKKPDDFVFFVSPFEAPEKFLVRSYLQENPNPELESALSNSDHHCLFNFMVQISLASDSSDARNQCYESFKRSPNYGTHIKELKEFLENAATHFSSVNIRSESL